MMFISGNLYISGYESSTFQGYRLHWSSYFPIAQPKQNWQNCEEFVKTSYVSPILLRTGIKLNGGQLQKSSHDFELITTIVQ